LIKLQNMNVVKFAATEEAAKNLIDKGFKIVEDEQPKEKPLEKMNKEELLAKAKEKGLDVSADLIKADIIKARGYIKCWLLEERC